MPPKIAIVSAGAMGSAVAARLVKSGCEVFTNLDGRSTATKERARKAGMQDVPLSQLVERAEWVLSILPPSEAHAFAQKFIEASSAMHSDQSHKAVFVDCNAVNPQTVQGIEKLFDGLPFTFLDAAIIGWPPSDTSNPTFYASGHPRNKDTLADFEGLSNYGLKIQTLTDEGARIGAASALKMSYAGISKGITGILSTMIISAHAASPATSRALLHELHRSQPVLLQRVTGYVPNMLPKAYRWIGEMEEIAGFVGGDEGKIYHGMADLYRHIEHSLKTDGKGEGAVGALEDFVKEAKEILQNEKV